MLFPEKTGKDGWKPDQSKDVLCLPLPIGERAIIFGGGHCAQVLAPLLHTVGFRVTIFEERAEYGCRENFPSAEQIIVGDYTRIAEYLQFTRPIIPIAPLQHRNVLSGGRTDGD